MIAVPAGWHKTDLGSSGRWFSGGTPKTDEPSCWGGDIPWIGSGSLTNFRLSDSERRVTKLGSENGTRIVATDTILMVVRGMSLKSEFRIGMATKPMAFGQDCKALVAREGIDPHFLAYAIRSRTPEILAMVDEAGHGTGRLNSDQLFDVEVNIPPLPEQQAIAEVLGALDDKIAANTKLVEVADEYMSAQFALATRSETSHDAGLFDAFEIDFGEPFKGAEFSDEGAGRPLIRIRDLKTFRPQIWTTEIRSREAVIMPGEIVVGMDAEFRATSWVGDPGLLNQRVCRVRGNEMGNAFVRESLRQPLASMENQKSATTVIHLNKSDLMRMSIVMPGEAELGRFEFNTEHLYRFSVGLAQENRTLAATRDALLPQLMSGKLRVRDAEKAVEAVV